MKKIMKLLSVVFILPTLVWAQDASMLRCRAITEATARLACYDAVELPSTIANGSAQKSAAALPTPPQTPAQFGLERQAYKTELDSVESRIVGRFEGWSAGSRIKLENGQVWQISDDTSRFLDANNPKVVVRRGALGAFYLEIEGTNHSPKVRRVQ
jgi:hypothetical protein